MFSPLFVNQDADPYLFQLYRRVGRASTLNEVRVSNEHGGPCSEPRYDRQPLAGWRDEILETNAAKLIKSLDVEPFSTVPHHVTIDVIIPSFRTPSNVLRQIVSLADPPHSSVFFIIIIDDPRSVALADVKALQSPRVRVRVNAQNVGAPRSRQRGLNEACAEWVLFLDDDVIPHESLLQEYVDAIRARGDKYCGFVGSTILPETQTIIHEATRLSCITFFYNLPEWLGQSAPWGVTANIILKRHNDVAFDFDYAQTGGGEDIDLCIKLVSHFNQPLGRARQACVTHEWWSADSTVAYLQHFWEWTMGDGFLMYKHPQFVYVSFPNVLEVTLLTPMILVAVSDSPAVDIQNALVAVWTVEFVSEGMRAWSAFESRHLPTPSRFAAIAMSVLIKNIVDLGHLWFHLSKGKLHFVFFRFDWFLGKHSIAKQERKRLGTRFFLWLLAWWWMSTRSHSRNAFLRCE